MQKGRNGFHESFEAELFDALVEVCSDACTFEWDCSFLCGLDVVTGPLLDEGRCHGASKTATETAEPKDVADDSRCRWSERCRDIGKRDEIGNVSASVR